VNPHLDDEVLSAIIDGEASPAESAHASTCDECHHRLGHLLAAAAIVPAVPAPPPGAREGAIAVALSSAPALATKPQPVRSVTPSRWVRPPRPLVLAAGALAAAVVVVAGVAALIGSTDDDQFAAGDREDLATAAQSGDVGFLGTFDDERALALELSSRLGVDELAAAPLPEDESIQEDDSAGGSGAAGGATAGGATAESDGASEAAAPPPAGSVARMADQDVDECSTAMVDEFPDAGERLLVARIVWHEEAAAVFVHRVASGERGLRAWIYGGDPCRLRTFISF
jgi:hypothetical protein